jgi:hypothetical protein
MRHDFPKTLDPKASADAFARALAAVEYAAKKEETMPAGSYRAGYRAAIEAVRTRLKLEAEPT